MYSHDCFLDLSINDTGFIVFHNIYHSYSYRAKQNLVMFYAHPFLRLFCVMHDDDDDDVKSIPVKLFIPFLLKLLRYVFNASSHASPAT